MPRFSILVPTYNQAKYLPAALDSLIGQSFGDWEALVVNDGSTDDTALILSDYEKRDSRIRVINKENGGTVSALNEGLKHSRGEWIFWLSTDDIFELNKLQVHADEIRNHPECKFFITNFYYYEENSNRKTAPETYTPPLELRIISMFDVNFVNGITICIHKSIFEELGPFDQAQIYAHDVEMWLRIFSRHDSYFIDKRLSVTRLHNEQDTITSENAASYEYAWFLGEYLNKHKFENLYRGIDLSTQVNAIKAVQNTFNISANPAAIFYSSGYSGALLERFAEWLTTECNEAFIDQIKSVVNQLIQVVVESDLPDEIKQLHINLAKIINQPYHYEPHDVHAEAIQFLLEKVSKDSASHMRVLAGHLIKTRDVISTVSMSAGEKHQNHDGSGVSGKNGELSRSYIEMDNERSEKHLMGTTQVNKEPGRLKVAVFSLDHTITACPRLRLILPMEKLADRVEYRWALDTDDSGQYQLDEKAHEWADLIVVQRFMPGKETQHLMNMLLESGKPLIYEADDLFVGEPPEHNPHAEAFRKQSPYVEALLRKVNAVTTSTAKLAEHYRKYCKNVYVLPNLVDIDRWEMPVKFPQHDNKVTIAYIGTPTHQQDLSLIEGALEKIAIKHGTRVRFLFMGCYTERLTRLAGFECIHFELGYEAYVDKVRQQKMDIILSPLVNTEFNCCKSNVKWLEFAAMGVPGIFSNLEPYHNDVIHGETGLLCNDTEQSWFDAIDLLVGQPELRTKIATQARQKVIKEYSMVAGSESFYQVWSDVSSVYQGSNRYMSAIISSPENTGTMDAKNYAVDGVAGREQKQEFYDSWVRQHSMTEGGVQIIAERMLNQWKVRPSMRLIVRIDQGQEKALANLLDNLGKQLYQYWSLTVVSNMSCPDPVFDQADMLEWYQASDSNITAINDVISSSNADWTALLRAHDLLEPQLLLQCADYINLHPEWVMMYCDEDELDSESVRTNPRFKPDFNIDLLRSTDYAGWFTLARTDAINTIGGIGDYPGLENHDLIFKLYERYGKDKIGHISDVLYHSGPCADRSETILQQVVKDHLARSGVNAKIEQGYLPGTCRVVYQHDTTPMVSIIIPTRDKLEYIQPCVDSVLEKTDYPNYEILIVDNNSDDPDVLAYFDQLIESGLGKVRVLKYPDSFNYAAICNLAAREASGEYLLQLNNDTEIIQSAWLSRMMQHAQRDEVGIVGARLVFPGSGKLQHAGIVMGMDLIADHPFCNLLDISGPGYMGRAQQDQNYSAVTGACLLTRKSLYEELGGMDENHLKVSYNDVDLCLKAGERGYLVVWTPYATVVHHGSVSQKDEYKDPEVNAKQIVRFRQEQHTMFERWSNVIAHDPAYNRHLGITDRDYRVEKNIVINWDVNFHDRTRILGVPLHGGSGEYRVTSPLRVLDRAALAQTDITYSEVYDSQRILTSSELLRVQTDTLLLNAPIMDAHIHAIKNYKRFNDVFLVYSLDDLITKIPRESPVWKKIPGDVRSRIREGLSYCDRMIVSTEPIAHLCRNMIDDIRVIPNTLEKAIWGDLVSRRSVGQRPRVGWAGAQQHEGDLRIIEDVVKHLANQVEWVFFGMCPDSLKPYVSEQHEFVMSYYDYPEKLASLNLDLALAPLDINPFNEAKSNLRLLEYGILGWPVVCSDILPYQDAPVCRVNNTTAEWINAIQVRINDLAATRQEGDRLRQWVLDNYILENNLDIWLRSLTSDQLWESTHEPASPAHASMR